MREVTGSLIDDDHVPSVLGAPDAHASVLKGSVAEELDRPGSLLDGSPIERVLGGRAAMEAEKLPAAVRRSLEKAAGAAEEARQGGDGAVSEEPAETSPGAAAGAAGIALKAYRSIRGADRLLSAAQDAGYGGADDTEEAIQSEARTIAGHKVRSIASSAAETAGHAAGGAARSAASSISSSSAGQGVKRAVSALESEFAHEKAVDAVRKRGIANVVSKAREFGRGRRSARAARKAAKAMDAGTGAARFGCAGAAGVGIALTVALFLFCGLIGGVFESYHSKANLNGLSPVERQVAQYLLDKGLDNAQIAGIMGNIYAESGFDPGSIEDTTSPMVGHGLCQWTAGRWTDLRNYALSVDRSWTDVAVQLDLLWYEYAGEKGDLGDPGEAGASVQWQWGGTANAYAYKNSHGFGDASRADYESLTDYAECTEYFLYAHERPAQGFERLSVRLEAAEGYYRILTSGGSIGAWENPCPGSVVSSEFGGRWGTTHKGIDLAAPEGTPYYAVDDGVVLYATNGGGYNGGAGNWVVIDHGGGVVTKYMHSSVTYVSPGDHVTAGQHIGDVGNTGESYGAHLHFQIEVDGVAVNPRDYIEF